MRKLQPALKHLLKMHTAFLLPPLICFFIVYQWFSTQPIYPLGTKEFQYLQTFCAIYAVLTNFASTLFFRRKIKLFQEATTITLTSKLAMYSSFSVAKFIMLFSVLIVCIVIYILTIHWSITVVFLVQAFILFVQRPHPILAAAHLNEQRDALFTG